MATGVSRADAPTPPTTRPSGDYVFRGRYEIPQLRSAVEVAMADPDSQTDLRQYRAEGFTCLRKSQKAFICSKFETPTEWPAAVDQAIRKGLASMSIRFPGPAAEPRLAFAGAQTEWLYREPVLVRGTQVELFKLITYLPDQDGQIATPKVVFPVSGEQAIPYADFPNENELGLHFILSSSKGKVKLGYMVVAKLER